MQFERLFIYFFIESDKVCMIVKSYYNFSFFYGDKLYELSLLLLLDKSKIAYSIAPSTKL